MKDRRTADATRPLAIEPPGRPPRSVRALLLRVAGLALASCASAPEPADERDTAGPNAGRKVVSADALRVRLELGGAGSFEVDVLATDAAGETWETTRSGVLGSGKEADGAWPPGWIEADDRAYLTVRWADGTEAWRGSTPVPVGALDPAAFRGPVLDAESLGEPAQEARDRFVEFTEQLLLVRDPFGAAAPPGGIARGWFGGLVAQGPDEAYPVVPTLADLCVALFAEGEPELAETLVDAGLHAPSGAGEWAVPRWMRVRERLGSNEMRRVLRDLVDEHRGKAGASLEGVLELIEGESDRAFALAWLASPARPRIVTSWRFDASRDRLLLRVDQVHPLDGAVAEAFPLTLPVSVRAADDSVVEHTVEVRRRRELFHVACESKPTSVRIDAEGTLAGLVDLVQESED